MIHLPRSSYTLKPWKNGLGMTEEIYVYPSGESDFLFRVSMAALAASGPFSLFPGIDRTLILLEGKPIRMNERIVPLLTPVEFPGEEEITATIESEGRDLNLMCRRGKVSGEMSSHSGEAVFTEGPDRLIVFALTDNVLIGDRSLKKYDSCLLEPTDKGLKMTGERFLVMNIHRCS